MTKRYFKVFIREPFEILLSLEDQLAAPSFYFKMQEYKERIIEVEYSLPKKTDINKFDNLIMKAIKMNYKHVHSIIEYKKSEEKQIG